MIIHKISVTAFLSDGPGELNFCCEENLNVYVKGYCKYVYVLCLY